MITHLGLSPLLAEAMNSFFSSEKLMVSHLGLVRLLAEAMNVFRGLTNKYYSLAL
ncbi:hypothetical protein GCM10007940_14210 [Portibacter lacus]|uniref:Uncharacterized protein n=1 Tax=Portibacter lacus TaxID=1099794 RepID=A0AA37SQ16_9BACT|nr:hypothetical protein GCM10007940_14210 [Portibacter lacus]